MLVAESGVVRAKSGGEKAESLEQKAKCSVLNHCELGLVAG
jgi:hypothetical protein